jgi:hypothetical protein
MHRWRSRACSAPTLTGVSTATLDSSNVELINTAQYSPSYYANLTAQYRKLFGM